MYRLYMPKTSNYVSSHEVHVVCFYVLEVFDWVSKFSHLVQNKRMEVAFTQNFRNSAPTSIRFKWLKRQTREIEFLWLSL